MRSIDLTPYQVGNIGSFDVRNNLIALLSSGQNDVYTMLQRRDVAVKIQQWPNANLSLDEQEYLVLLKSIVEFQKFEAKDITMIDRVLGAPKE